MLKMIQQAYNNLTKREKKALYWTFKIILTETSKLIILWIFFAYFKKEKEFLFSTITLLLLRCNMGGLHFHTYYGCLIFTWMVFVTSIIIFPNILHVSPQSITLLLIFYIILNITTGPVINSTRPPLSKVKIKSIKLTTCLILLLYILLSWLPIFNKYMQCGIWIITEQTLQLIIAKTQQKGDSYGKINSNHF